MIKCVEKIGKVWAYSFEGHDMSNLQLFKNGPKFTITCGIKKCRHIFDRRTSVEDYPEVICPACGIINKIHVDRVYFRRKLRGIK